jgi:hypothetical protein
VKGLLVAGTLRGLPGAVAPALRACAWAFFGGALVASGASALAGLAFADGPAFAARAGGALLVGVLVLVTASVLAGNDAFRASALAVLVVAVAVAAGRFLTLAWPALTAVLVAGVAAALAGAVTVVGRFLPARVRIGPWAAAAGVAAAVAALATAASLAVAAGTVAAALPPFTAELPADGLVGDLDWRPAVALILVTVAAAVLVPARLRVDVALGGWVLLVLAAPVIVVLPWWAPAALAVTTAGALMTAAVRSSDDVSLALRAAAAAPLAGYAVLAALARPVSTAGVLAAVVAAGVLAGWLALRRYREGGASRLALGGIALGIGLLAWPGAVAAGLVAAHVEPWWVARGTVAAAAVLIAVLAWVVRGVPAHRLPVYTATLVAAAPLPLWGLFAEEPAGVYAAVALALVGAALSVNPRGDRSAAPAAVSAALPSGLWWAYAVLPALYAVLLAPYGWLAAIWDGRPDGVGLHPEGRPAVEIVDAVALGVVALAVVAPVARWASAKAAVLAALPVCVVTVPVALAAAGAPWPWVPAASLLLGLAGVLVGALRAGGWRRGALLAAGLPLAGAGLAGTLPTRGTTLAGLGIALAAAAAVGAAGRSVAGRVAGWWAAVGTAALLGVASTAAAGWGREPAAFAVLGVAAVSLALSLWLAGRRPVESAAVGAAAHAGALTALLLAIEDVRPAAAVCALWGVMVGLAALVPGQRPARRRGLAAAAAGVELLGWWLLMVAEEIAVIEAYTVPAAAVGLLAGWLALRQRPGLSSWIAYGPALAAAFLPSLAAVLTSDGQAWRRLLLGAGGLVALLAGAAWRRQAPVVLGGGVLAVVALHELLLIWELLPGWIPLAAAGLLLVGLAMTLERRRRDLARVRAAVGRMT